MTTDRTEEVWSQKAGAEDVLIMDRPTDRFRDIIPFHHHPPVDDASCYRVALLAQACESYSFADVEAGPTSELHLWLLIGSETDDEPIEGADFMLPSMRWLVLAAATSNGMARANLESFGFDPMVLTNVEIQPDGGVLSIRGDERIEWNIAGPGDGPTRVGVHHEMFMPHHRPGAVGHRVAALLTDAVIRQPGKIRVLTTAFEPFLVDGEELPAAIHRMPKLQADVVWRRE